jgi:hypothetical protein
MELKSDFCADLACYGLKFRHFSHLSDEDASSLMHLISRISELSFRRGYQHGAETPKETRTIDPVELRFSEPLDRSPSPHGSRGFSAIERLRIECSDLMRVGLDRGKPYRAASADLDIEARQQALDELTDQAQDLDMGY